MKIYKPNLQKMVVDLCAFILIFSIVFIGILSGEKAGFLLFVVSVFSMFCIIIIYGQIKVKNIPIILRLYLLISFLALISLFYAEDVDYCYDVLWKILSVSIIMYFVNYYTISFKNVEKLIYFFILSTFLLSIYNIVNYKPSIYRELPYGGVNPVASMMVLSIILVMFLIHLKKRKLIILIPVYLSVLLLTQSQKSILSLIIILLLYISFNAIYISAKKARKYLLFSIILIFFGYYLLTIFPIFEGAANRTFATINALILQEPVEGAAGGATGEGLRTLLIKKGWQFFLKKPFFGYGINNYRILFGRETGLFTYSHFTPIELLVGMGIFSMIFYYLIHLNLIKLNYRRLKISKNSIFSLQLSSIIGIIIIGFFMQIYFDASVHFYLMLINSYNRLYFEHSMLTPKVV